MIITNARIAMRGEIVCGTVEALDGRISAISSGSSMSARAIDFESDFLLPGLIDLHTDALQTHHSPRPGVRWPIDAALAAHDAQMATSGVTTVFDALPLGTGGEDEDALRNRLRSAVDTIHDQKNGFLRAEHFLHLRLEVARPDTAQAFLEFAERPLLRLISLMDHTPGQGQFADLERWRAGFFAKQIEDLESMLGQRIEWHEVYALPNRKAIAAIVRELGLPLASHDDRTVEEVQCGASLGVSISEFPVTLEAAEAARKQKLAVLMGAPNLVLGGSHSGNVAVADVAARGWLDGLSSDYVPASLLHGVFLLAERELVPLPDAIATVTSEPARMAGLTDRGAVECGLRADFVRVRIVGGIPRVISVWSEGHRVV